MQGGVTEGCQPACVAREMSWLRQRINDARIWLYRHTPRLVWPFQEIEATIGLRLSTKDQFNKLAEVERLLSELGVAFDTGYGFGQRDWEWDWSLRGPVHVRFVRARKKPIPTYGLRNEVAVVQEAEQIKHNMLAPSEVERGN